MPQGTPSTLNFTCAILLQGFTLDWCKNSDRGLPGPDLVMFLDLTPEAAARRGAYGEERYERTDFQQRVYDNYKELKTEEWTVRFVLSVCLNLVVCLSAC